MFTYVCIRVSADWNDGLNCSYSIMRECWNDNTESRPTFQLELKEEFDGLMFEEED